jgi:hypothetical protein
MGNATAKYIGAAANVEPKSLSYFEDPRAALDFVWDYAQQLEI